MFPSPDVVLSWCFDPSQPQINLWTIVQNKGWLVSWCFEPSQPSNKSHHVLCSVAPTARVDLALELTLCTVLQGKGKQTTYWLNGEEEVPADSLLNHGLL